MRTTASGLLIVALNKTELNGNGMLQLTWTQKKSLSLFSSHLTSMLQTSAGVKGNLKQIGHSSWTWQPYIHWGTCTDEKESESGEHLHFFSVNWWSKHDFPTPMSPVKREKNHRSTKERTEQQFSTRAYSVNFCNSQRHYLKFHVEWWERQRVESLTKTGV